MPPAIRLILALSADRKHWIATTSDGEVVRAELHATAFYEQLARLRERYGDAVQVEEETVYPPEYTQMDEELQAAKRDYDEAAKKLDELETTLASELLRQSIGGVLRRSLTEIGERLGTSEERLRALLNFPRTLLDGVEPSPTMQAPVLSSVLKRQVALAQAQRAAMSAARRRLSETRLAFDEVLWRFGFIDCPPNELTRISIDPRRTGAERARD